MVKLSPVFHCATYGLRVAASMMQVPYSRIEALNVVPWEAHVINLTPWAASIT